MRVVVVALIVLSLARPAVAQPAPVPVAAPVAPSSAPAAPAPGPRFQVALGFWSGAVWGESQRRQNNGSYDAVQDANQAGIADLRLSAGWRIGSGQDTNFVVGGVLDIIPTGGAAGGVELHVNHPLSDRWRLGLRVSASTVFSTWSVGNAPSGRLAPGDRFVAMAGPRLQHRFVRLGVDSVLVRYHRGQTMGVLIGAELVVRPGARAGVITAVVALVGGIVIAATGNYLGSH